MQCVRVRLTRKFGRASMLSPKRLNIASAATPPSVQSGPVHINICRVWVLIAILLNDAEHCLSFAYQLVTSKQHTSFLKYD